MSRTRRKRKRSRTTKVNARSARIREAGSAQRRWARRSVLVWLVLVTAVAVGAAVSVWRLRRKPLQNIVLVIIDTLRIDSTGCYGGSFDATPSLDAIASEGVRFDQAVSTSGWTLPAMASLFTGAWPRIHGAVGKDVALTKVREELPTAAEVLKDAGYTTLGFANAAFVSPMLGLDRGFDVFDHRYAYNWEIRRADETIDAALAALRENRSEPTLLMIHLFDPHLDYDPPARFATMFTGGRTDPPAPLNHDTCLGLRSTDGHGPPAVDDVKYVTSVYTGEVAFVDAQIGRLVNALKEMELYDNTTLVITADHGEEFWEHGGFEHGHTLYDELVRIPLIIKPSQRAAPSERVVEKQVRILDIMPTLFEMVGVKAPASFVGRSLLPLMTGAAGEDLESFCESTLYGADKIALRTGRYKFIHDLNPLAAQREELYDLHVDPAELNNLVGSRAGLAAELRQRLMKLHTELADEAASMSTPEPVDMSPRHIEQLRSLGYLGR